MWLDNSEMTEKGLLNKCMLRHLFFWILEEVYTRFKFKINN